MGTAALASSSAQKYNPTEGNSTAWSMPSVPMSVRRALGSDPPGAPVIEGQEGLGVREARARRGQGAQRYGQDLLAVHHDVLVAVRIPRDDGSVRLGDRRPGLAGFHHVPVGVHDEGTEGGTWSVHDTSSGAAPGAGARQSSVGGMGGGTVATALLAAIIRNSSSGRCPRVFSSTSWVSGHVESAWG